VIAVVLAAAPLCASETDRPPAAEPAAIPDTVDSARVLAPVVVRARRPSRQESLDRLPSSATVVELESVRDRLTTTAEVLSRVPGLRVQDYGGLGGFSTVSIRGSTSSQVSIYLDGLPLARAGLGVVNLADLPFASIERIEVYRGTAPAEFAGAGPGGAIQLVSRAANPSGPAHRRHSAVVGGGSFGARRFGASQEIVGRGWSTLVVADRVDSDGDFSFHDDDGTMHQPNDDAVATRRNNWAQHDEVLVQIGRALPGRTTLRVAGQWVRQDHGVPGRPSAQAERARAGATWSAVRAEVQAPHVWHSRLQVRARIDNEWRRDTFEDLASEIGLGYQHNRDVTRSWGAHTSAQWTLHPRAVVGFAADARRERFEPWRGFPTPGGDGPAQRRTTWSGGTDARVTPFERLALHGGVRVVHEHDAFHGDLRTAYSPRAAHSDRRRFGEPRAGARLRLLPALHLRASWGRHHRTPGFLELFGDGGSVAGNSDLRAESGTNRDLGVQFAARYAGLEARLEATWFRNDVDNLITFLPQSQRTFVARNIGAARLRGDEWTWRLAAGEAAPRWTLDGHCTRLDTIDRGVDTSWYAGNALPGRPALQVLQRAAVRVAGLELGYEFEHLADNYLDRANLDLVRRRDLHGVDAQWTWRGAGVQVGVRNLTDERASDVADFPLPGRTVFVTTSFAR